MNAEGGELKNQDRSAILMIGGPRDGERASWIDDHAGYSLMQIRTESGAKYLSFWHASICPEKPVVADMPVAARAT